MSRRSHTLLRSSSSSLTAALAATAAANFAGCAVVPLDPRTGYPYPTTSPPPTVVVNTPPPIVSAPPGAGTTVWSVRLYPLNDEAAKSGVLQAQVFERQGGRGSFSVNYRGETLHGESTRVSGQQGLAHAASPQGLHARCDYMMTSPRLGTGRCQFSDGARWQMHFGE